MASISNIATSASTRRLDKALDDSLGTTNSAAALTAPIRVALMTANGSQTAAGTEVTGGSYARQTVTFTAASAGATSNNVALTYTSMPATTVVGIEIYDSTATPVRLHWGALTASKTVNAGDTFSIASGAITVSIT